MGCDHRDQPVFCVSHDGGGLADDAQKRLGAGGERGLGPWADRVALQIRLYRRQARRGWTDQDDGAGDGGAWHHRQCDLPRLCADAFGGSADPRPDEDPQNGSRHCGAGSDVGAPALEAVRDRGADWRHGCVPVLGGGSPDHGDDDQRRRRLDGFGSEGLCPSRSPGYLPQYERERFCRSLLFFQTRCLLISRG